MQFKADNQLTYDDETGTLDELNDTERRAAL